MDINVLRIGGETLIKSLSSFLKIEEKQLKLISQTENFVYQYMDNYILRVAPVSHREIREIYAELDWIEYLYANGVPACRAVRVAGNDLINYFDYLGINFICIFFEHAKGHKLEIEKFCEQDEKEMNVFFETWGRTLGKMHHLSKTYVPKNSVNVRKQWSEVIPKFERVCDKEKFVTILEKQKKIIDYMSSLIKDADSYGIIHSDFSYDNFFIEKGTIYPFDFDHIKYHWFAYDIAITLDSVRYIRSNKYNKREFMNCFFEHFMDGYLKENTLSDNSICQIPEFTKLWRIDNFIPIVNKVNIDEMKAWEKRMIKKIIFDIENEKKYFELS